MTTSARDNILTRLRQSPTTAAPAAVTPVKVPELTYQERVECFCTMMTAVHGEVHHTSSEAWFGLLQELIRQKKIESLLIAPHTRVGKTVIEHSRGKTKLCYADQPVENYKQQLFEQIDASLTGCRGAVAETGTLILWPSKEEPRTMSLVPPIHFVLLDKQKIHNTWADVMTAEHWENKMPTNALLISGPSKTADIQQTLAYGAHGPKELIILLI